MIWAYITHGLLGRGVHGAGAGGGPGAGAGAGAVVQLMPMHDSNELPAFVVSDKHSALHAANVFTALPGQLRCPTHVLSPV